VNLAPTEDSIVVEIRVPLLASQELFLLTLTLTNANGDVLYVGGPVSILVSSTSGAGPPVSVPLLPLPDSLIVVSGNGQAAPIGSPLPLPLVVRVLDADGIGFPDVSVSFTPTSGSVSPQTVVSDSMGNAQANWTLGSASGQQSVTVSVSGNPPRTATFRATALLPPQPGADIVVFNDINMFDTTAMQDPNNQQLVRNLVGFTSAGPRSDSTELWFDFGRNSPCAAIGYCGSGPGSGITTMLNTIGQAGFTITEINSTSGSITSIPPAVKAIFLWNPVDIFTLGEVTVLRQFAAEGGRIVFIGEHVGFYDTTGINTENQFLRDMGAQMTNTGGFVDCVDTLGNYAVLPQSSLRTHQVTTGLTGLTIACASVIQPGPQDFPLFYDRTNSQLLAGVATVGTQPAPAYDSEAARQAPVEREVRRQQATQLRRAAAGAGPAPGSRPDRRP
jgi:hypothetical protein